MQRHLNVFAACCTLACLGFLAAPALGQADAGAYDLSRIMPEKALFYVGWSGTDADVPGGPTALSKLLAEPEMKPLVDKLWPDLVKAVGKLAEEKGDEEAGEAFAHGAALAKLFWKCPVAIGLGEFAMEDDAFRVAAYLVVRAGEKAAGAQKHIEAILKLAEVDEDAIKPVTVSGVELKEFAELGPKLPIRWGVTGDYFIVTIGERATETLLAAIKGEATLAKNARFVAATKAVGGSDGYATQYLDIKEVVTTLKALQPVLAEHKVPVLGDAETFDKILKGTGLGSMDALAIGCRPEAGGFMTRTFLAISGEAAGLAALTDQKPVTEQDFALVPADARWAWIANLNLARGYRDVMVMLDASPELSGPVKEGIAEVEKVIGFRIHDDFLAALGERWIVYDSPSSGGLWVTGITAVVELRDAERVQKSIESLLAAIAEETHGKVPVEVEEEAYRGQKIHFVNVRGVPMPLAPAWSVHGERMIVGLYPQMVRAAIDQIADKRPGIASNPDFARGLKLMPKNAISVSYVDTARGVASLYSISLPIAQVLTAMGQGEGFPVHIGMLPSCGTLTKHLFGNISASARVENGVLWVSHGPLPVGVPDVGQAGFAVPMMAAIALPSLARARELSKRTVSMANLRGIGVACATYANENNYKLPPDLETLIEENAISPKQLISPLETDPSAKSSYVYLAGQTGDDDPANVLAYEKLENYDDEGTNVLFLDYHVEWMKKDAFEKALEETKARIARLKGAPETK